MRVESQQLKAFLLDTGLVNEQQFDQAQKKADHSPRSPWR